MSQESDWSPEEWRAELCARAEQRWGAERRVALEPLLESAATALWRLTQASLEPLEAEPDFIGGVRLQPRGR